MKSFGWRIIVYSLLFDRPLSPNFECSMHILCCCSNFSEVPHVFFLSSPVCASFHFSPRVSSQRSKAIIVFFYISERPIIMLSLISPHPADTDADMNTHSNYMDSINANRVVISFFVAGAVGVGSAVYWITFLTRRPCQAEEPTQRTLVELSLLSSTS
jgi:hypothetical protein